MANITATKQPNDIDLAYGKNIVTLTDTDVPAITTRFLVRVIDTDDNQVGELRQLPNTAGYAHFDLQNILKNQVTHNPAIEVTSKLTTGNNEVFAFTLDYGYIDGTGTAITSSLTGSGEYVAFNGRKAFNVVNWPYTDYIPEIGGFTVGPVESLYRNPDTFQTPLTDRTYGATAYSAITDGKPSWGLQSTTNVYNVDKYEEDHYTLSWINEYDPTTNPTYTNFFSWISGINGFNVALYNDSTELADTYIENLTSNGGGPDVSTGDALTPSGSYRILSIQASQLNSIIAAEPTATHYYIAPFYWSRDPATSTLRTTVGEPVRVNIVDSECNDFDHIQVSWVNSFGMRDYFTFTKRNDYNVTTQQDTYMQLDADWSGQTLSVNSYNRGERVFNKSMEENYVANTKYLSDAESTYLKNLYVSPDVKVRFAGSDEWVPVILTDTQYTERTFRKDKLFQHTINFRLANPQQIQRG